MIRKLVQHIFMEQSSHADCSVHGNFTLLFEVALSWTGSLSSVDATFLYLLHYFSINGPLKQISCSQDAATNSQTTNPNLFPKVFNWFINDFIPFPVQLQFHPSGTKLKMKIVSGWSHCACCCYDSGTIKRFGEGPIVDWWL